MKYKITYTKAFETLQEVVEADNEFIAAVKFYISNSHSQIKEIVEHNEKQ